jgi:phospholipid/cholesterol/gamma-HCH transport system substrate-binding protein
MPKKVELKVGFFIVITTILILTSLIYLAYSKGFFSKEHAYTISSKSGEELEEGMPVYFSGFKIGRVEKLELSDKGLVLVKIRIPDQHVKWIKSSSVFSINKPLIGSSKLIVTTNNLNSPALSPQDIPEIVRIDDINDTIKRVQPTLEKVDKVVANIERITANLADPRGDVNRILKNAEKLTANLAKKESVVEMVVGNPESVKSIHEAIKKAKDILVKIDTLAAKTDDQVYGNDGALPLVKKILKDLILKLEKMNAALDNVIKISSDAADSTKDLKSLRNDIDMTVNSIDKLVEEIDKLIPLKKEPKIKLP